MVQKLPKRIWNIVEQLFIFRLKKRKLEHDIKQLTDTIKDYGEKNEDVVLENGQWYLRIRNTPRLKIIPANFLEKTDMDTLLKCCTISIKEAEKYLGAKDIEAISLKESVTVVDIKQKRTKQAKYEEA